MIQKSVSKTSPEHWVRRFISSVWGKGLVVSLLWQLAMFGLGVLLSHVFSQNAGVFDHTNHWDAGWYLLIFHADGYSVNAAAPVFYPLFPLAVHLVQFLSFGLLGTLAAGFIVNTVGLWFAAVALLKISKVLFKERDYWLPLALFLAAPAAIFLHFFYAEALFCALAFWAYYLALTRRWGWMAGTLAALTATKLPAVLVVGLCGLEFMRAYGWQVRKILNWNLLWFSIVPLGFVSYGFYLWVIRDDFLAMFHGYQATDDWVYHVFNPNFLEPIAHAGKITFSFLFGQTSYSSNMLVNDILPCVGLLLVGAASLYAIFRIRDWGIPLGITGLVSIIFFSLNNNLISVHRYLLPSLALYLVPVVIVQRFKRTRPIVYSAILVGLILQLYLFSLFVRDGFAG